MKRPRPLTAKERVLILTAVLVVAAGYCLTAIEDNTSPEAACWLVAELACSVAAIACAIAALF